MVDDQAHPFYYKFKTASLDSILHFIVTKCEVTVRYWSGKQFPLMSGWADVKQLCKYRPVFLSIKCFNLVHKTPSVFICSLLILHRLISQSRCEWWTVSQSVSPSLCRAPLEPHDHVSVWGSVIWCCTDMGGPSVARQRFCTLSAVHIYSCCCVYTCVHSV
jgi:hypothetical protein